MPLAGSTSIVVARSMHLVAQLAPGVVGEREPVARLAVRVEQGRAPS
jgi:hypothetical protein